MPQDTDVRDVRPRDEDALRHADGNLVPQTADVDEQPRRRRFVALGLKVVDLQRKRVADFALAGIPAGASERMNGDDEYARFFKWRTARPDELEAARQP